MRGRIQRVFVHGAFGQIGHGAITRVIEQQAAFVGFAAIDVARMRDDAAHRRVRQRVDRHALKPQPAAVLVAEAVFKTIELRLRIAGREQADKPLMQRPPVVGMHEVDGIAA